MNNRIIKSFESAIGKMKSRNWDTIYVFVDLHETLLKPTWDANRKADEFYPYSVEVMKLLTNLPFIKLVMYTSSTPKDISSYIKLFLLRGIIFDYINDNPEVVSTEYGDYTKKPYMNVLLDDKAGFDPEEDWICLRNYLSTLCTTNTESH